MSKVVASQRLLEARYKPEAVKAVLKLRVWESPLQRGVSAALISIEDRRLEPFLLLA
jgi:hypothetical protein